MNKALKAEKAERIAKHEMVVAACKADRNPITMAAVVRSSAELSAWIMRNDPPRGHAYGSRAGRRQWLSRPENAR
jgi:uncharacterized protein (DUF2062 family)